MKFLKFLIILSLPFTHVSVKGQNAPKVNSSTPSGSANEELVYPIDFNSSPNSTHTNFNFSRVYTPLVPMSSVPTFDNTRSLPVLVNTNYMNGWGTPLVNVYRNNSGKDIISTYSLKSSADTVIGFLSYADSFHSKFQHTTFSRQKNYFNGVFPNEGITAYDRTIVTNPSGVPTLKMYSPGKYMTGNNLGTVTTSSFNLANDILYFNYDPEQKQICKFPVHYYAPNELRITNSVGQHYQEISTYTDKNGRVICRKQYAGGGAGNNGWLETYYLYDELGRLKFILPPKASVLGCVDSFSLRKLCFQFDYDTHGKLIQKQTPGRETQDLAVYNYYEQKVMFQTPNMGINNQWDFTVFDKLNRPIFSGIFSGTHYYDTREHWQELARREGGGGTPSNTSLEYWIGGYFDYGEYPTTIDDCEILAFYYYDDYSQNVANEQNFSSPSGYLTGAGMEIPQQFPLAQGKLVASKVRLLDTVGVPNGFTNNWITSIYFYDEKGRAIQVKRKNLWNQWDVSTTQYNFVGQPVLDIAHYTFTDNHSKVSTEVRTKYLYGSRTGRLEHILQEADNSGNWVPILDLAYDELGRVNNKTLGQLQDQQLTYNIRGQLNGINAAHLYDASLPDNMAYVSELNYELGFDSVRYDRGLSGYKWRTNSTDVNAYGYRYDAAGRMIGADFNEYTGSSWSKAAKDFSVSGITYDANGNITYMKQRGYDNSHNPIDMDMLTYNYLANSNKLVYVTDAASTASPIHDFVDGTNGGGDYTYDMNGNLTSDSNKHIKILEYNFLDKLSYVNKDADNYIRSIYDIDGHQIQRLVVENGVANSYTYWGPFEFRNDTLLFMKHSEGKAYWNATDSKFDYDFFIKDHQENVRTVYSQELTLGPKIHAGFELVRANVESSIFDQINEIREWKPGGVPDDQMAGLLDGCNTDERVGAITLLHAMAGDQFNLQAFGYYESTDTTQMNTFAPANDMLGAVLGTLTGPNAEAVFEGGSTGITNTTINNLLSNTNYDLYDAIKQQETDPNYPRAYLNYMVFNEDMEIQTEECKVVQLKGPSGDWSEMALPGDMTVKSNGYVLVYLSNESCIPVYVDNARITNIDGHIKEEQHYYPHGLVVEDGGQDYAPVPNKTLFESNKIQDEIGLELFNFNARNYDQQLGRFTAVDPLADAGGQETWTPYHFTGNDPANFTDPSGLYVTGGGLSCPKNDGGDGDYLSESLWTRIVNFFSRKSKGGSKGYTPRAKGTSGFYAIANPSPAPAGGATGATSGGGGGSSDVASAGPDNPAVYQQKQMIEMTNKVAATIAGTTYGINTPTGSLSANTSQDYNVGYNDGSFIVLPQQFGNIFTVYDLKFQLVVGYNLRSFVEFTNHYFPAYKVGTNMTIKGASPEMSAEYITNLVVDNGVVSAGKSGPKTSNNFTFCYAQDVDDEPGATGAYIHFHPSPGTYSIDGWSVPIYSGPSGVDIERTTTNGFLKLQYFDVIVDKVNIYLYRGKSLIVIPIKSVK